MRLAPLGHPNGLQHVRLSIADSIATTLPPAQGIWYWERPSHPGALSPVNLITSLRQTLESYPQFAGRLEEIPPAKTSDLAQARHGRFQVVFGSANDPGVEVMLAHCDCTIRNVLPSSEVRNEGWNASVFELNHLFGGEEATLALEHGLDRTGSLPLMVIKATRFADGGLALAVRLVHAMGDLPSLMQFLYDWAAIHRACLFQKPPPLLSPIFNPAIVDAAAAGDISKPIPDAQLVRHARRAPIHRFDWWAPPSKKGVPPVFAHRTRLPESLQHLSPNVFDQPIPWHDWDLSAETTHYVLHFTRDEILRIYAEASEELASSSQSQGNGAAFPRISHLDALLAHLWSLLMRARGVTDAQERVYLNFVLDYRPRLGLPSELVSSPSAMVYAKSTGEDVSHGPLAQISRHIRWSIAQMDGTRIAAFLHDCLYQPSTHRYWQYFAGRHHFSVTSWLNRGVQDLDFTGDGGPLYFTPLIPDFMMVIYESAGWGPEKSERNTKKWYERGVDVRLQFEKEVVEKIRQDPQLRMYKKNG
ncbi:transferase family protein [Paecilomyces variotii No. 5]|uniref:Transferase family protein n=1 Tax=Byssochlamys spectabilis (strain No. 5 / NBRC 109023) TaxID=1356009 RepID=V5FND5_BYSSN|nr:transferase family protein [Paecilomyces variotii No. 5]